jgi:hypothetical protein
MRSATGPHSATRRSRISRAALLVKVTARISHGATPLSRSRAIRCTSTRVLPVPAPASTSSGPSPCSTAARCSRLSEATMPRVLPHLADSANAQPHPSRAYRGAPPLPVPVPVPVSLPRARARARARSRPRPRPRLRPRPRSRPPKAPTPPQTAEASSLVSPSALRCTLRAVSGAANLPVSRKWNMQGGEPPATTWAPANAGGGFLRKTLSGLRSSTARRAGSSAGRSER